MAKPYIETIIGDGWIMREFSDVDKDEMQWHIDNETRLIYIDNLTDWKFQYDNALPFIIKKNTIYTIPKGKYHRLLAGTGKLFVFIKQIF